MGTSPPLGAHPLKIPCYFIPGEPHLLFGIDLFYHWRGVAFVAAIVLKIL